MLTTCQADFGWLYVRRQTGQECVTDEFELHVKSGAKATKAILGRFQRLQGTPKRTTTKGEQLKCFREHAQQNGEAFAVPGNLLSGRSYAA